MRLRMVKDADKKIAEYPQYIVLLNRREPKNLNNLFDNTNPLHVEIGTGKGQFIHTLAKMNPSINYIAIEKFDYAIVKALGKIIKEPLDNLYLVRMDAHEIEHCFKPKTIEKIYLNFSDPWPKIRHEKRRLTHLKYLSKYEKILKDKGAIELKTDNRIFFEYSLLSMENYGVKFVNVNLNVNSENDPLNIPTEFEEKYRQFGPIYKITATFGGKEDETNL